MSGFESWLANNKALWGRVYDEVIVPDLEKEWKKQTHENEPKKKDEDLQILNVHISKGVVDNAKLKEENTRLKDLLQKQNGGTMISPEQLTSRTDDARIPINDYREITEKLDEMNKRYEDAAQRIKYLERKNVAVMQKNKEMKDSVKAWKEYCERHIDKKKAKIEAKPTKAQQKSLLAIEVPSNSSSVPSSPAPATFRTPQSLVAEERSSPGPFDQIPHTNTRPYPTYTIDSGGVERENARAGRDVNMVQNALHDPGEPTEHSSPPPLLIDHGYAASSSINDRPNVSGHHNSGRLTSSQTTIPEAVEQEPETATRIAKPDDDDDEPEYISERPLKRKRKSSAKPKIPNEGSSDGTPARPVRIKEELYSSPPPESTLNQLLRKETMDLDDLGPKPIMTPRRRRLRRVNSIHSNETGTLRNQRSNSAPFSNSTVKPEPMEDTLMGDVMPGPILAIEADDAIAVSEPNDTTRGILQPLDPNVVAAKKIEDTPNKRMRREEGRQEAAFDIFLASGEVPPHIDQRVKRLPPHLARAHFNERMRAAKNDATPLKTAVTTPKTLPTKPSSGQAFKTPPARSLQRKPPATVPRPAIVPDGRPLWQMRPIEPNRRPLLPTARREPSPQPPLRDKPISELHIHDFKPNPAYNGGYTHAFADTVRSRTERVCLPGCTLPTCCGSTFRTLALASAPLSPSSEEHLLQDYLGDAYSSFGLTQMSSKERDEIVLQARTRALAREHGKHRRVYEGRRTPPGFWRVDFPDTQEREEDRVKAGEMERGEVRERWLEAMRGGGRWLFRDE